MRLPPLMQPWAAWLALFPDDLATTLGELVLRLHPMVAPLRRHAASASMDPAGIGDIVQRGNYERLLISQWAYADAAPDEFIRRAANGELLFTGPEPAGSESALRSVVLFDAGPAQLGEPRLAHVALFILLARRAELAGAQFQWGLLQEPGVLHDELGVEGIGKLLTARTLAAPDEAGLEHWNALLKNARVECWLVGDPASPFPAAAQSRVLIRRSWLSDQLDVELVQRQRHSKATLPLPAPEDGVRLLRRPFERTNAVVALPVASNMHSLKRPPLFGNLREWLAVGTVEGGVTVYRIPDHPQAGPGRPRTLRRLAHGDATIAAGLSKKSFGTVALQGNQLHFANFPGPFFARISLPLPDPDFFQASTGALRWAPAFHWLSRNGATVVEEVLVLDKAGRLGCWTCRGAADGSPPYSAFRLVSRNVTGAIQDGERVLFAVDDGKRTDVYFVSRHKAVREHLHPIMHRGDRFLFGQVKTWRGGKGAYALRLDPTTWVVGNGAGAGRIALHKDAVVLGCSLSARTKRPALVVLDARRTRMVLHDDQGTVTLFESIEPIIQASFDPAYERLAWLGQKSGMLTVHGLGMPRPYLQTIPTGGPHAG